METQIYYELECEKHFWHFATEAEAKDAAEYLSQCFERYHINEVRVTLDNNKLVTSRIEKVLQ
jgi:hypothetical protein